MFKFFFFVHLKNIPDDEVFTLKLIRLEYLLFYNPVAL